MNVQRQGANIEKLLKIEGAPCEFMHKHTHYHSATLALACVDTTNVCRVSTFLIEVMKHGLTKTLLVTFA